MCEVRWTRIAGDGIVYSGPCLLHSIHFVPDETNDYVDIYDGRDATTGRLFGRLICTEVWDWNRFAPNGVRFDVGIYLDGFDSGVATTVVYEPCE